MALLKKKKTEGAVEKTIKAKKTASVKKSDKKGISKKASLVLMRPKVTEKTAQFSDKNVMVFEVSPSASKIEIKQAFREIYGITPLHVNTSNLSGKVVRFGRTLGKRKNSKKAVITLSKNTKLDIFGGK
jgi:large subunit ribosomal protein L23